MKHSGFAFLLALLTASHGFAGEPIRLANNPALSADGQWLAFDWNGDIWLAPSTGGEAKPRSAYSGRDSHPKFSPDGKDLAFVSDRDGSPQIYTLPIDGGLPRQLTFHTASSLIQEYSGDGKRILIKATRDHFWRHGERFFTIAGSGRSAETPLFDDYGDSGVLSPDGKKLLFTREGGAWWRKGYQGSGVAQVWLYDLDAKTFVKVLHLDFGCRWPLWKPDGKGFYYVGEHAKGANLYGYDFAGKTSKPLTTFKEDSVVFPNISRDGSKIVFRHLFDLYTLETSNGQVKKLDLFHNSDRGPKKSEYKVFNSATSAAFSQDGLDIAFIAGGHLFVMDTELREPRLVTPTPPFARGGGNTTPPLAKGGLGGVSVEGRLLFTPDGQSILFISNLGDRFAISKTTRGDAKQFWWQNTAFTTSALITTTDAPSKLKLSPDGKKLAYVLGRGDLWTLDLETKKPHRIFAGWSAPDFDFSPDGKWLAYALQDEEFNRDIWVMPSDGSGKPFNLSRHPYAEHDPVWSPDGKMLAFAGRRASGDPGAHVCIVALNPEDDEKTARDRKLEKALDKMKGRTPGKGEPKQPTKTASVTIDFDRLPERIKRINLGEGNANTLFWSPDSKKLAFTGSFEGKPGTYAIDIGDTLKPKALNAIAGTNPVWLKTGNQIVWLVGGVPTSTPGIAAAAPAVTPDPAQKAVAPKKGGGKGKGGGGFGAAAAAVGGGYTFSVRQPVDLRARNAAIFDTCWRIMRDHWYDGKLGNSDWNAVRAKYRTMAYDAADSDTVTTLVQMMLGELNGSHLGFTMNYTLIGPGAQPTAPRDSTAHLGARFDPSFAGPGLKIRDVLAGSPADMKRSKLKAGEIITKIDGIDVSRDIDLTLALNGPIDRAMILTVQGLDGQPREVALRPITYGAAQTMLYDHWLDTNRKLVADGSKGTFGYLHISAMSMPNFKKFEEELVSQGAGKDGLVIDVRENPGGSIADHLLTALTQPMHAITVPRGGGPGYPLDRKVYISWHKPIVVLCNQNSGSNAEIFSHAIKTLKRGQLVGVPTAGAVVSTGTAPVLDAGTLRLPTRGWFTLNDGEDMEKHGAAPHHLLWLRPSELPQGRDAQLAKALEVLHADVQAWKARPQPKLRLSTDRP